MSSQTAAQWSAAAVTLLKNVRDILDEQRAAAGNLAFLIVEPKLGNFVNDDLFSGENISKISEEVLKQRRLNYILAQEYCRDLPEIEQQLRSQLDSHIGIIVKRLDKVIKLASSTNHSEEMQVLLGDLMRPEVNLHSRMSDILNSLDKSEEINVQTSRHNRMPKFVRSMADRDCMEPNQELKEWGNSQGINGRFLQADWSSVRTVTSVVSEKLTEKLIDTDRQTKPDVIDMKKILVEATWAAAKEFGDVKLDSNALREAIRPDASQRIRAETDRPEFWLTS